MPVVGSFSIRIVDGDGEGVQGVDVTCKYGIISGVQSEYTDEDGWASFPVVEETTSSWHISVTTIWVNSVDMDVESFRPDDGDTMSFTLPSDDD